MAAGISSIFLAQYWHIAWTAVATVCNEYRTNFLPFCQCSLSGPPQEIWKKAETDLHYRSFRHRFSSFPCVFKQILRWFPSSKLLLHAAYATLWFTLISFKPVCHKDKKCFPQNCSIQHWFRKPIYHGPCLQPLDLTVLTLSFFMLFLSARWVWEIWETSNKIIIFILSQIHWKIIFYNPNKNLHCSLDFTYGLLNGDLSSPNYVPS
jgi:hypothetical protein